MPNHNNLMAATYRLTWIAWPGGRPAAPTRDFEKWKPDNSQAQKMTRSGAENEPPNQEKRVVSVNRPMSGIEPQVLCHGSGTAQPETEQRKQANACTRAELDFLRQSTLAHLNRNEVGEQSRLADGLGIPAGTLSKFIHGGNLPDRYREPLSSGFDADMDLGLFATGGFASFDGTTIRQASYTARIGGDSPSNTIGGVTDADIASLGFGGDGIGKAYISDADSSGFEVTYASAIYGGYLALNFNGKAQAWAGIVNSPTVTGVQSLTGPSFTPQFAMLAPTMCAAVDTNYQNGDGGVWGLGVADGTRQSANQWSIGDNDSPLTAAKNATTAGTAVLYNEDGATLEFAANFDSFDSAGVDLDFTVTDGTVRKWPALFIAPV